MLLVQIMNFLKKYDIVHYNLCDAILNGLTALQVIIV